MLNKIVIVGRLTKDAQIYEKEEVKIATFCVATERNYKDDNNEQIVDYILCKAYGRTATNIEKYTSQDHWLVLQVKCAQESILKTNKHILLQNYT